MTDKEVVKLQIWIEKTYGENAIVRNNSKSSITLNSSYVDRDGVDIHTDGVVECNSKDKFGKIDILVNSAGIHSTAMISDFFDVTEKEYD